MNDFNDLRASSYEDWVKHEDTKIKMKIAEAKKRFEQQKHEAKQHGYLRNFEELRVVSPIIPLMKIQHYKKPEVPVLVPAIVSPIRMRECEKPELVPSIAPPINDQIYRKPSYSKIVAPVARTAISKVKQPVDPSELRLFVKNLAPGTTEAKLRDYFGRWGNVTDVFIRKANHRSVTTRCAMAYITYSSYFNESPLSATNIHIIDGMSVPVSLVHVHPNSFHGDVAKSRTLMISGTIQDLADKDLLVYFSRYGKVSNVVRKFDLNNVGKYQRFAFIVFTETSSVDKVIDQKSHIVKGQIIDARRVRDKN